MKTRHLMLTAIMAAVVGGACLLGIPAPGRAQTLIHACVNPANGNVRIVAPGTTCGNRDTLVTWPAEATGGVSYYQRSAAVRLGATIPQTVVALCDAPDDTATGGGYWWERDPSWSTHSACWIEASAGCRASGLCGGPAGQDGWAVIAWNCAATTQSPTLHVYVTCSQATE